MCRTAVLVVLVVAAAPRTTRAQPLDYLFRSGDEGHQCFRIPAIVTTNAGTLLAFATVCLAILILRKKQPDTHRPFKTPFSPYVPLFGILACIGVTLFLNLYAWIAMGIWLSVGLIVYFVYGKRHSKLNPKNAASEPAL